MWHFATVGCVGLIEATALAGRQVVERMCSSLMRSGPCDGSVFIRDCSDCTLCVATRQLRTRDCKNLRIGEAGKVRGPELPGTHSRPASAACARAGALVVTGGACAIRVWWKCRCAAGMTHGSLTASAGCGSMLSAGLASAPATLPCTS